MHGLVSVQFLAALNVFMGGDKTISKNAMSEFLNNLSMQALSRDDDRIEIRFEAITVLNTSLKNLFKEDQRHSSRLSFVDFTPQTYQEIKDPNQLIEEDVVNNIISSRRRLLIYCVVIKVSYDFSKYSGRKKETPGNLYKSTTENKSFFNREEIFIVRKIVPHQDSFDYWISKTENREIIDKRFLRQELFALKNQFD